MGSSKYIFFPLVLLQPHSWRSCWSDRSGWTGYYVSSWSGLVWGSRPDQTRPFRSLDHGRAGDSIVEHTTGALHESRTTLEVLILEVYTNHRPSSLGILHKFERLEKLHLLLSWS